MTFVSYAQNGEDVLLHRVFGGQETGFYVDVGAYHPVDGSVTKAFYDRGWSGINVEPGDVFDELVAARPRDVNLRMAALDRTGDVVFRPDPRDPGTSRVLLDDVPAMEPDAVVHCDTLENIVRDHARGRPLDFVKIDAEGAEEAIVRATNWRLVRPRVLVVEATRPWSNVLSNAAWEPLLIEAGYERVFFDGINCFYLPEEQVSLLGRHFETPINVLDSVAHYDPVVEALRAEAENLRRELGGARGETERATGLVATATAELALLRGQLATSDAERADLRREHEATAAALDQARAAHAIATQAVEEQKLLMARSTVTPTTHADDALRSGGFIRSLLRSVACLAYRGVRPVARPLLWRLRSFLVAPVMEQVRNLVEGTWSAVGAPEPRAADPKMLAEVRRLANEIEATVLTIALLPGSASRDVRIETSPKSPPTEKTLTPEYVPLRLPDGRRLQIEATAGDLSVAAALAAADGEWEPHVGRFLAATVREDWVCADVGANIGAHTLSLATLARHGRVFAFEADPANYTILARNAAALVPPAAVIQTLHLALWDGAGTLVTAGANEVAGCSFVSEGPVDAAEAERRLRAVVSVAAIGSVKLHTRHARVRAETLDAWAAARGLDRLDFIKLDVEGAEPHVLRGAERVIREHRPMLLVEYNPATAAEYFGQAPDGLYRELEARFETIGVLMEDGGLVNLPDWRALEVLLRTGRGWEDLVCSL